MSLNTEEEGQDLLQGAITRWLASDKPIQGPEQTYGFLVGAIRGITSNFWRHAKLVHHTHGRRVVAGPDDEQDPVETGEDSSVSQNDAVFAQQVYDLLAGDPEVQELWMYQSDHTTRAEIQHELGWDNTKYETIQKRKRRLVARWKLEGKL
jgi:DNA-directed RNA polymerase specialized sigma24 family protein